MSEMYVYVFGVGGRTYLYIFISGIALRYGEKCCDIQVP